MKKIIIFLLLCVRVAAQSSVETPENEFVAWFNAFNSDSSRVVLTDSAFASPLGEIPRMFVIYNLSSSKALMFQGGRLQEIAPYSGIRAESVLDFKGRVLDFPQPFKVWSLDGKKSITVVWQPCNCRVKLNYYGVGFNNQNKQKQ